jgi:hypothetical protein
MPWDVRYIEESNVVETRYSGRLTTDELHEVVVATFELAKARRTHMYLGDCSELGAPDSLLDIYSLVKFYETLPVDPGAKEALVLPATQAVQDDLGFYETVAQNRGFNVRLFTEREQALAWLTGRDDQLSAGDVDVGKFDAQP